MIIRDNYLKWPGTVLQAAGCLLLALHIAQSAWAYPLMFIGAALWLAHGVRARDWALVAVYFVFETTNSIGIVRWML